MTHYATAMIQIPLLVREGPATRIRTPADTAALCSDHKDYAQETFFIILLDTKNKLISKVAATTGLVDATMIHPREAFRAAIAESAVSIVLAHNHPTGDPTPSAEDLRITKQLISAGRIIDIKVLDHVIIGRKEDNSVDFLSMREAGLCDFS